MLSWRCLYKHTFTVQFLLFFFLVLILWVILRLKIHTRNRPSQAVISCLGSMLHKRDQDKHLEDSGGHGGLEIAVQATQDLREFAITSCGKNQSNWQKRREKTNVSSQIKNKTDLSRTAPERTLMHCIWHRWQPPWSTRRPVEGWQPVPPFPTQCHQKSAKGRKEGHKSYVGYLFIRLLLINKCH